jgi:hypothetical protein
VKIGDRINPPRRRQKPTSNPPIEAEPPKPERPTKLELSDMHKLDALRSKLERLDLMTQLGVYKIEESKRAHAALSSKLEKDVVERQRAKEAYESFRRDIESRYGIDLQVVSYDDETGQLVWPQEKR